MSNIVVRVDESFFVDGEHSSQSSVYVAKSATTGPWSPKLQHGGPPSALLVHAAEVHVARETGRTDLDAVRAAVEFAGPVPVGDVEVTASIMRAARSAVLVQAELSAGDRHCLSARVWLSARVDVSFPPVVAHAEETALVVPESGPGWGATAFPYAQALTWRTERGELTGPGPCRVWARQRIALVAGHEPSGLQRAVLLADSGNGVSAVLDWAQWSFMNVDLDVHLARPLVGEWICLDAVTQLGPAGTGLASSTLSDVAGVCGTGAQTLIVRPHSPDARAQEVEHAINLD